uniref:Uncharacterized protein n=1 Tax=Opuntia streptacantha TaxID=393608 RepID=A0A7C9EKC1_OPUST
MIGLPDKLLHSGGCRTEACSDRQRCYTAVMVLDYRLADCLILLLSDIKSGTALNYFFCLMRHKFAVREVRKTCDGRNCFSFTAAGTHIYSYLAQLKCYYVHLGLFMSWHPVSS